MKVLYLACDPRIDLAHTAGHTTHITKTIKGLEDAGHTVHRIIAGERKEARQAKGRYKNLKARLPASVSLVLRDLYALAHDSMLLRRCYAMCREQRFDFVYERASDYHITGYRLKKRLGIPHILEVNTPIEELITLYGCARCMIPVLKYYERLGASHADAVIIGSADMRSYLIERRVHPDRIFLIYPTAEALFFRLPRRQEVLRQQLGLQDKVVVGFVGSMAPYQRADLLLQAAAIVRQAAANVHFLFVGSGNQIEDLQRFVQVQQLDTSVTFTGRVPYEEVPEYCGVMDMCVIPHGAWYASPTKLFEYAATGKPIIAPRLATIQALIKDGENGLLTAIGDVQDLAAKILILVKNPALGQTLGRRLQQEIQANYNWHNNTQILLSIVESLQKAKHVQLSSPES
jgi:glycosyltransferase involved in cell wall biosynthesis